MSPRFEEWFRRAFPDQAPSLLSQPQHPACIIIEAAYHDGAVEEQIRIYSAAVALARNIGQVVGEHSEYFITLDQLGRLVKDEPLSPALRCTPNAPPSSTPPRLS